MFIKIDDRQYKYIITINELLDSDIIRPDIQRLIDYNRVEKIINYQKEYYNINKNFILIGDIVLAEVDKQFYVVDGMHRLEALKELVKIMPDYRISLVIIKCNSIDDIRDLFLLINKSVPVPEYVIKTSFTKSKRDKLDEFLIEFSNTYKPYISESKAPRRPNINIDFLMSKIEKSGILDYFETGIKLFKFFMYVNNTFLKRAIQDPNNLKCEEKSKKYSCNALYITNDPNFNWLHNSIYRQAFTELNKHDDETENWKADEKFVNVTSRKNKDSICVWQEEFSNIELELPSDNNSEEDNNEPTFQNNKKTIPKTIRGIVWRNYFKTLDNECTLCDNIISLDNFECGHIKSRKNGGLDVVNNLLPICGKCNKAMSSTNLYDYCNQHDIKLKYHPQQI